jgi:hypothetical protein
MAWAETALQHSGQQAVGSREEDETSKRDREGEAVARWDRPSS